MSIKRMNTGATRAPLRMQNLQKSTAIVLANDQIRYLWQNHIPMSDSDITTDSGVFSARDKIEFALKEKNESIGNEKKIVVYKRSHVFNGQDYLVEISQSIE